MDFLAFSMLSSKLPLVRVIPVICFFINGNTFSMKFNGGHSMVWIWFPAKKISNDFCFMNGAIVFHELPAKFCINLDQVLAKHVPISYSVLWQEKFTNPKLPSGVMNPRCITEKLDEFFTLWLITLITWTPNSNTAVCVQGKTDFVWKNNTLHKDFF